MDQARADIKQSNAEVKEAGKGVRKTLKFEVADINEVPSEWILLDEKAVRAWAQENKEMIKEQMKKGENVMRGVKFWLESGYVTR